MSSTIDPWQEYRSRNKDSARTANCDGACWCRRKIGTSSLGGSFRCTTHQSRYSCLGNSFCRLFGRMVCGDDPFLVAEVPEVQASVYRRVRYRRFPAKKSFLLCPPHRGRSRCRWTLAGSMSASACYSNYRQAVSDKVGLFQLLQVRALRPWRCFKDGDVEVGRTRQREVLWQLQIECVDLLVAYIAHYQRRIVRG